MIKDHCAIHPAESEIVATGTNKMVSKEILSLAPRTIIVLIASHITPVQLAPVHFLESCGFTDFLYWIASPDKETERCLFVCRFVFCPCLDVCCLCPLCHGATLGDGQEYL